jgi:hypothetical protein
MSDPHIHHASAARIAPSLLRLSIAQRLAIAAGLAVLLWGAVLSVLAGIAP